MSRPRRVLVYRIGSLGDTIVALPAIHAVRQHYRSDHLALLCDRASVGGAVLARVLLERSGLFDEYLEYEGGLATGTRWQRIGRFARLLKAVRAGRYRTLVYLAPSVRSRSRIRRDRRFFRAAGIREFVGLGLTPGRARPQPGAPMSPQPREADLLMQRLSLSGVEAPSPGRIDLALTRDERRRAEQWRAEQPDDGGRPWLALGPGSKMPVKVWPLDRFVEVTRRLIDRYDVWPVVFGGPEDRGHGTQLVQACGRGAVAAGDLDPRLSAAAMEPCAAYLGNDTGTMHLAASVGLRTVVLFTARDWPGKWDPPGAGHVILRRDIDCAGCMLTECIERGMECILSLQVDEVERACRRVLEPALGTSRSG